MREILKEVEEWLARGDRVALATVIATRRSAPRPPGAKRAVNEHGSIAGAVSGGCVIALRSEAAYVGAMGSRRAQERRRQRLLDAGLGEAEIERMAAPIGLDLGATSPEETALSIMSEVVAVRNGRDGGRLMEKTAGRIHEVGT